MYNNFNWDSFGDFSKREDGGFRLPICLVLDSSGSMNEKSGGMIKINELNKNVLSFIDFVRNDSKASRLCDLSIVSFGGNEANVVQGYSKIDNINYMPLTASGLTPMGDAVSRAIDLLEKRREYYKKSGIEYYKPIMLLMSDGEPTDNYIYAANRLSSLVKENKIKVFPVGIGNNFNANKLSEFSPILPPKRINDVNGFMKLFDLLSRSTSNPSDDSIDRWFKETI